PRAAPKVVRHPPAARRHRDQHEAILDGSTPALAVLPLKAVCPSAQQPGRELADQAAGGVGVGRGIVGMTEAKQALPPRLLFGAGSGCFASKQRFRIHGWSWRFRPTPRQSMTVSMPRCSRSAWGLTPESKGATE